jgi:hypothetical protein
MATSITSLRARITDLVTTPPWPYTLAPTPDGTTDVPVDALDASIQIEVVSGDVQGAMGMYETRVDDLVLTVTRLQRGAPQACYDALLTDVNSLSAAIIRDGALNGGDFHVPDAGRGFAVSHTPGAAWSRVRLTLPVDYEVDL